MSSNQSTSGSEESPSVSRRINRFEFYRLVLEATALRSTCLRLQVGAIIVDDGRPISFGYNGAPKGQPHCTPNTCGPDKPCDRTIHAEMNAIGWAARKGLRTEGTIMVMTDSPCLSCAKVIINAGIEEVHYLRLYRDSSPITYLEAAGIRCWLHP